MKWFICLIPAFAMGIVCSCDKKQMLPSEPEEPVLMIDDKLEIPYSGGSFSLSYTIENMDDDLSVNASCEEGWIHDIDCAEFGKIRFNADASNESLRREAIINIFYGDIEKKVSVIQEEFVPDFRIELSDINYTTFNVDIFPKDKEMYYPALVADKEFVNGFSADDELIQNVKDEWIADAERLGVDMKQYLDTKLMKGDNTGMTAQDRLPGREYVVYTFGMNYDLEALTPVYKADVMTKAAEMKDVSFEMNTTVAGANATLHVVPSDKGETYYVNVFLSSDLDSQDGDISTVEFWQQYFIDLIRLNRIIFGSTPEDVMSPYLHSGDDDVEFELAPNTDYTAIAMAASSEGVVFSKIFTHDFRTANVNMSDNIITIEAYMNAKDDLWFDIYTTNNDSYSWGVKLSSEFEGMSDEEMLRFLLADPLTPLNVKQGYFPGGCGVTTGERYTVYAFGYSNGVATTGLARVDILAQEGESASGSNAPSDSGQAGLPVGEMLEISQFNVECIASY